MYLGSWKIDDNLTFTCNTHRADTGAASDADAAPTYRVYEDETGTPILTGTMALLDDSNTVGLYSEQIALSAANGFEKGKCYAIRIAATVNSVAGATLRNFQIEAEVDANVVSGAVPSVTGAVGSVTGNVGGNVTGSVGSVATGGITAASIATGAIDADAIATDAVTEIQSGLATASALSTVAGYIDTEVAAIKAKTDNLPASPAATGDAMTLATDAVSAAALSAAAIDEILDEQIGDGTLTLRQALRILVAGMAGKVSGAATTTVTIRNVADTANVVVATVDADGNRSATMVTP